MDIRTGQSSNRILPRQPDTQLQTLRAGQRLNAFSGLANSPGGKALQQLISQILTQLQNKFSSPIQPGPIQPVYGSVTDPGMIQPVYGSVIDEPPLQPQPVYGTVIADPGTIPTDGSVVSLPPPDSGSVTDPGEVQPVYGAVIEG